MTKEEREQLQDILIEYIENPRKMGTCIKNIESLFHDVHVRWSSTNAQTKLDTQLSKNVFRPTEAAQIIISDVCNRYQVTYEEVIGKRRSKYLIQAREQIAKAMHNQGFNYSDIGRSINRHPSTIIHSINKNKDA